MNILDITKIDDKYTYILLDQEYDKDQIFDWVKIGGSNQIIRVYNKKNFGEFSSMNVDNFNVELLTEGSVLLPYSPYKAVTNEVLQNL